MSYAGTKREIADRQEELRRQLQLPTRFISTARSDAHNWLSEIVRGFDNPDAPGTAPACSDDAERWEAFKMARSGSNLWSRREDAVHRWWNCEIYAQEPPPTPDARTERECEILRQWIPGLLAPPSRPGRPMTAAIIMYIMENCRPRAPRPRVAQPDLDLLRPIRPRAPER